MRGFQRLFLRGLKDHIEREDEFSEPQQEVGIAVQGELEKLTLQVRELQAAVALLAARPVVEKKRKVRVREDVVGQLREHPKVDATTLGGFIGLSRARTNEYLVELVRQGRATSMLQGKKRLYWIIEQESEGYKPAQQEGGQA